MASPAHSDAEPPQGVAPEDVAAVANQLRRPPRGLLAVAHRCPCGNPDVVQTVPRLDDGTPFPTLYYLTCPRAAGAVSTLESSGLMRELTEQLAADLDLARAYGRAHLAYVAAREAVSVVPEITGVSAGGMPTRVKCLHVLVAHALAAGPGVNPMGDRALALLDPWWRAGSCVPASPVEAGEAGEGTDDDDQPVAGSPR